MGIDIMGNITRRNIPVRILLHTTIHPLW